MNIGRAIPHTRHHPSSLYHRPPTPCHHIRCQVLLISKGGIEMNMKRFEEIRSDYELRIMDDAHRNIFKSRADKYVGELLNTIKQLHAENERYKKALEQIANIRHEQPYDSFETIMEEIADESLEPEYDESARAYELDGEFK